MLYRLLGIVFLSLAIGALALLSLPTTQACAPAMRRGEEHSVEIASETALIIWDEKAKKQHFIRRASFQAQVPYFGFLVPTPTQPELAEAPDEVFTRLEDWTKPEIKTETRYVDRHLDIGCAAGTKMAADRSNAAPGAAAVQEVAHVTVGPYDAVVLKASDGKALREWLDQHGYDARPALMKWIEPYVTRGWFITAFQIKKEPQARTHTPQAVRMSFAAKQPFFPYSEAEDQREPGQPEGQRLLRVFLLADQRMQGALEDKATKWPGRTEWAGRLDDAKRQVLADKLSPAVKVPQSGWLTVFDDRAAPRPGTSDLYFSSSPLQSDVHRPPIIHYRYVERTPPGEIIGLVLFVLLCLSPLALFGWLRWRRRRHKLPAT
jgi:hypothetical protein